jgi:hypothetical protein
MRVMEFLRVQGLPRPKRLCVSHTAQPDVVLNRTQWVRYHLVVNKKRF